MTEDKLTEKYPIDDHFPLNGNIKVDPESDVITCGRFDKGITAYKVTKGDEIYSFLAAIMRELDPEDRIVLRDLLNERISDAN